METPCPPWILQMHQYPGPLETHHTPDFHHARIFNNFGVKYERQENIDHLIAAIKTKYKLTKDWTGNLYCGIKLNWDYNKCTLDISMPGYIVKQLQQYKHASPTCQQHCPFYPQPKQYGAAAQCPIEPDTSPPLLPEDIKQV
jgi:hypothetical protein